MASAEEDQIGVILTEDEIITVDSEEIVINGDESDGEDGEIPNDKKIDENDYVEEYIEEDQVPTLENSVEQEPLEESIGTDPSSNNDKNISQKKDSSNEVPFSAMILIFIGIPIALLLFFVIKKYIKIHK